MKRFAAILVALMVGGAVAGAPPAPGLLDGFEDTSAWEARPDGGQPPRFAPEATRVHEGRGALRVTYRNGARGWGNIQRALRLPSPDGALALWLYKERSDPEAALHLWLEEPDGDMWVAPLLEAGAILGRWAPEWRRLVVPLASFRFDGRGNRQPERDRVVRMIFGCNFGDLEVVADELTHLPTTPEPARAPRSAWTGAPPRGPKGSVAILRDDLPRSGAPSDPEHLSRVLQHAGYGVTFLRAAHLLSRTVLTREHFDVLVLPDAGSYPAEGKEALVAYLQGGGAFLSMGGYAFNNPVVFHRGQWVDREGHRSLPGGVMVDVGSPGDGAYLFGDWHAPESGQPEWGGPEGQVTKRWTGARAGVRLNLDPSKAYVVKIALAFRSVEWVTRHAPGAPPIHVRALLDEQPLGSHEAAVGTAVLEFAVPAGRAKGTPAELVLEAETWSPAGLGGTADSRELGVAVNWVKAIPEGISEADLVPPPAGFDVRINTARGDPQDALGLDPLQIGVFDPSYPLRDATRAVAAPRQYVVPASLALQGPFEGWAAAGMFGSNSPVFPAGHARWIPLLEARDADGRHRGALGALALHYAGPFAGSGWAFFGVTNRDLFAPGTPGMERLLVAVMDALHRRTFLHGLRTEWPCYHPGEAVKVRAVVRNAGKTPQRARVRFRIEGARRTREVDAGEIAPGASAAVEAAWSPFPFSRDLYRVRATLLIDGQEADAMETGFVVWDHKVVARGPRIDLRANAFRINGRPAFLCGTNQTGMIFASSFEDALVWDHDLAQMRDYGVNIMRVLHFSPFAKGPEARAPFSPLDLRKRPEMLIRQTDALVQLCQKHGVALFLSLHDWMGVALTDEELDAQRDWARFWAGRYRDVPGIFYDVQNEPTVDTPDSPDVRREWNAFLRRRYGTDEALRAAWGPAAPEQRLGEIPVAAPHPGPDSARAHDFALFRTELLNRWIRANVEGVRAGDPDALCTVGYLQMLETADKLIGARYVDFSNMHSYLPPADLPANLKLVDRRFDGKSFSLGEFGAKCHPAWPPWEFVGATEAQGADYFLRVGHYALGLGASFIANWDWKDMVDCVFPWGIVHPGDGVPKDVLPAYRNMSLFFRLFRPRYRDPGLYLLVPDAHRLGASMGAVHGAVLNAARWLIAARVPFNVINELDLERLPREARTMLWPVPYCPEDETYARVREFVRRGGTLLVTGDLSFDVARRRTRAARLEELCGVRAADVAGAGAPDLRAPLSVTPTGARPGDESTPALYVHSLGEGRTFYTPIPVEAAGAGGLAVYGRFLSAAGVRPEPVEAPAEVDVFPVETEEPGATWAFYNTGSVAASVSAGGVRLEVAAGKPGLLRFDGAGRLVAVEAQGRVSEGGSEIATIAGHAMVAALDNAPLARSRALLVLPVGPCEVRLRRTTGAQMVVQAGEFRRGRWHALATGPADEDRQVVVRVTHGRRGDLFLVCGEHATRRWAREMERLLRFDDGG